jgi:hypothetical protein
VRFRGIVIKELTPAPSGLAPAAAPAPAKGFVSLFNGKDLSEWKVFPAGTGSWTIEDGAIVGIGPTSHLFSERGDYENFVFRVEAKINDGGNSGQYFRAQFGPRFPKGYEAQIDVTHRDPIKTGSLYPSFGNLSPEKRAQLVLWEAPHRPGEWFTQEVIADGNHITIKVNGNTTVDFVDESNAYRKGHFALQQHDPRTKVWFRKIEVKELPPTRGDLPTGGAAARGRFQGPRRIVTTQSGLRYEDIRVGTGPPAKIGDTLEVHYTGWLKDGTKFDSSHDRGQPFKTALGPKNVIKGWLEGVPGMKVGGIRKLVTPPHLAYGPRGAGKGKVPPNAELTFEIELLKLEGKE